MKFAFFSRNSDSAIVFGMCELLHMDLLVCEVFGPFFFLSTVFFEPT